MATKRKTRANGQTRVGSGGYSAVAARPRLAGRDEHRPPRGVAGLEVDPERSEPPREELAQERAVAHQLALVVARPDATVREPLAKVALRQLETLDVGLQLDAVAHAKLAAELAREEREGQPGGGRRARGLVERGRRNALQPRGQAERLEALGLARPRRRSGARASMVRAGALSVVRLASATAAGVGSGVLGPWRPGRSASVAASAAHPRGRPRALAGCSAGALDAPRARAAPAARWFALRGRRG